MERIAWLKRFPGVVVALLVAVLLASCSSETSDMPAVGDQAVQHNMESFPQEGGDDSAGGERLVIRTKTLRLEVEETAAAIDSVRDLARSHSGTVSDMEVATDGDDWVQRNDENGYPAGDGVPLRGWITVRVPTDDYEDFVAEVADLGVLRFQSEATSDVTQEHVDLSARLENLRAQEVRLREFFEAAKDVKDMLAVETELGRVRGDIESLDAQVTLLERQAAMATVTVELTEPRAVVRPGGGSWGFVDAITTGVRGAAQLLTGLLTFVIASSPLWVTAVVLLLVLRPLWRRRRRRRMQAPPGAAGTDRNASGTNRVGTNEPGINEPGTSEGVEP